MEEVIAERKFVLDASQNRIWSLIGKVVLGNLPGLERIEVIDENNIRGLLRVRIAFITLTMHLHVEVVDMDPPQSLDVMFRMKSKGGIIRLNQKTTLMLSPANKEKTEVVCKSVAEEMGPLVKLLGLRKIRILADDTLNCIEERLSQVA